MSQMSVAVCGEGQGKLQAGTHFLLHLADLLKCKHTLTNDTPGLVRISIVTNNL